jgi:hypothetical protein
MKKAVTTLLMLTAFLYFGIAKHQSMETKIEEIWKDVVGYEGLYQVSNLGMVLSLKRTVRHWRGGTLVQPEKILRLQKPKGYARVTLTDVNGHPHILFVHRLVAYAFLPTAPPSKNYINHKNFARDDNRPINLEWVDAFENMAHMVRANRSLKGSKNPSAILTEKEVMEIKISKLSFREMSEKYNVSISTIEALRYGRTWKYL